MAGRIRNFEASQSTFFSSHIPIHLIDPFLRPSRAIGEDVITESRALLQTEAPVRGNNDRPDLNPLGQKGVRAVPNASSPTGYVNPDANNAPIDPKTAQYISLAAGSNRTGTAGRNTERTRGINNFDFTVGKQIWLTERTNLQFRTEFFNLFNHPQYGSFSISPFSPATAGPSANVTTTPAGQFLQPQFGDGGGRVIRYLLKLTF
ncbi:MAG: hypothetical protein JST85_24285 [Acidobacteria bacterium]|nr:hypothetical protein [Acidobacteriota bacterium]